MNLYRKAGSGYHVISNWRKSQDEMPHLGREVFEVAMRGGRRLIVPVHEAEGYA